jgi:hypothetical protein
MGPSSAPSVTNDINSGFETVSYYKKSTVRSLRQSGSSVADSNLREEGVDVTADESPMRICHSLEFIL